MNPLAKSYAPPPPPLHPSSQTSQPTPDLFTLVGWPSFPSTTPSTQRTANMPSQPQQQQQGVPGKLAPTPARPATIPYSFTYYEELSGLVHSLQDLRRGGYVLEDLTNEAIEAKKRCERCGKCPKRGKPFNGKVHSRMPSKSQPSAVVNMNGEKSSQATTVASRPIIPNGHPDAEAPPPKNICYYHTGTYGTASRGQPRVWTCCNRTFKEPPCIGAPEHTLCSYHPGQLEERWQYWRTPAQSKDRSNLRSAVAIDCEMGTALDGDSELIRVSVLDYFTGQILVDSLVYPDVAMVHYNTKYSGVTRSMMETAKRNQNCFFGRTKAREAVWRFVGPLTIVVGHSAYNDLKAMRWIHNRVIDSFMLEPEPVVEDNEKDKTEESAKSPNDGEGEHAARGGGKQNEGMDSSKAGHPHNGKRDQKKNGQSADQKDDKPKAPKAPKGSGPRSLKTLARVKLGREIQNQGKLGHDSVEDALAARDLVHWQVLERQKQAEAPAVLQ